MMEFILGLINQLIPELLTLLAFAIVYYVRGLIRYWQPRIEEWFKAHVNERNQQIIKELGFEAFAYAETVFREKNGAEKLDEALKYFNANMSKYGLGSLTAEEIRAAIEKAWVATNTMKLEGVELIAVGDTAAPPPAAN